MSRKVRRIQVKIQIRVTVSRGRGKKRSITVRRHMRVDIHALIAINVIGLGLATLVSLLAR